MDFDAGYIIASLIVSAIGFVFFSYGRKMRRAPQIVGGLVLMIFPYFVQNVIAMSAIALLVIGLLWGALRYGY